ncbi:MAG: sulfatase-like hydrolase/transferase, partial [Planctomycetota bacterium]
DVIEEIDWSVGCVLDALRSAGIAENTLVIFTTDNGPWLIMGDRAGSAGPLREGKASSYEGGQRVPCIAWWPGHVPAGSTCEQLVTALDLFPTAAAFAGVEVPRERPLDGFDVRGILLGQSDAESRYEDFVYARDQAIRVGDWKYRRGPIAPSQRKKIGGKKANRVVEQLFNLAEDVGEKKNLIEQYPEKAAELRARLAARKQLLADDAQ